MIFHSTGDGKVCLATTAYSTPDSAYTMAMAASMAALNGAGFTTRYMLLEGNCHVDDARNDMVQRFLATDCTDLIFIDADVSWNPEQLVELMSYDCDIVGGVYPYRSTDKQDSMPVRMLKDKTVVDGLLEVEGLPTGFMRIRRKVFERLIENERSYPATNGERVHLLFERTLEGETRYGGDIGFCRKWRATGGEVYAAFEMTLTHSAKTSFSGSLGSYVRAYEGSTLKHVCNKVKAGTETAQDIDEAVRYIGNPWGANLDILITAILLARRANGPIIEAGSGLSTLLMAAATDQMVYCLEHHSVYAQKLKDMAQESGIGNIAICYNPLKDGWYDMADKKDLPDHFALGLVDGPPRQYPTRMRFFDHFSPDVILADDVDNIAYANELKSLGMGLDRVGLRAGILNLAA